MSEYIPFNLIESYKKEESIQLDITLCKPDYNRTPIQTMGTAYNKELVKRFGSVDEIRFQIPQTIDGKVVNDDYSLIKGDFVVLVEFDGHKQYFIIKTCNEIVGSKKVYKDIVAYSYEYMFTNKLVRGWNEGQQPLSYVMDYVISLFPSWSIGITEPELMSKERTMEVSEQTTLDFLNDIQKKYLSVFEFDTVNRTIDIRKLENIGKNKGFVISERSYAKAIDINPNFQEVITRLRCYGNNNLSINSVNTTGQPYIELYDYYMGGFSRESDGQGGWTITGHSEYMSNALCMSLLDYRQVVIDNESTLSTKNSELSVLQSEMSRLMDSTDETDKGLNVLETGLNAVEAQIDALIRAGVADLSALKEEESIIKSKIADKQLEVDSQQLLIDAKLLEIQNIKDLIKIENNLTAEEIKELDMFTREKTWSDNSYIDEIELYEEGKNLLLKMAQPSIAFSTGITNFLKCLDRSVDWEYVTTGLGDVVTIESDSLNLSFEARLVEYTYSESDNSLSMNFSNKGSFDDPSIYLKDLLKESVSTSTTLSMEKTKYGKYDEERSEFEDFIDGKLDLATKRAFAGIDQEVVIDKRGILLTDTSDVDRQVKLIGDLIAFTNDGWNTSGTAISSEGVVGEAIYGKILAGANLTIENSGGTFKVDESGVRIVGTSLTITDNNDTPVGLSETNLNLNLQKKVNSALEDNYLTLAESKVLEAQIKQMEAERDELLQEAISIGIASITGGSSIEWSNYYNAVQDLRNYLDDYWINKIYPVEIDQQAGMDREVLTTKLTAVQGTKTIVTNKITQKYTANELQNFTDSTLADHVSKLQDQIDGRIDTWFDDGVPTLTNEPALTWKNIDISNGNDNESLKHVGDIYYDGQTGYAYRFANSGVDASPVFQWVQIQDDAIAKALADSLSAQQTAKRKKTVFISQPTTPYDIGDLWAEGSTGELYRCIEAKSSGNYEASHWEVATKYTDDTRAIEGEENAKKYTDLTTGNLVNNTSLSGTTDRWIGNVTVVNRDFFGATVPVQQVNTDGNIMITSDYIDVDPSKAYEITFWFLADGTGGKDYFGLYTYDENDNKVGIDGYDIASGSLIYNNSINPYFWSGDNPVTDGSGEMWIKRTGYIAPVGTSADDLLGIGINVQRAMVFNPKTKKLQIRWLNYNNAGVYKNVWVAYPKVVETSIDITSNTIKEAKVYNGVKINSTDGVVVRTNDNDVAQTIRTTLNANEGIKIDYYNGSSWLERFKVDSTTGNVIANDVQLKGGAIKDASGNVAFDVTNRLLKDVGGTTVLDLNAGTLYWNNLTISGNVHADSVSASDITGTYITGKTIRTASSGSRIEMKNTGDIVSYNSAGNKHGFSLEDDGGLYLYNSNSNVGRLNWDTDGKGTTEEAKNRVFLASESGYALKIESGSDMSISVPSNKKLWMEGSVHFDDELVIPTSRPSSPAIGSMWLE